MSCCLWFKVHSTVQSEFILVSKVPGFITEANICSSSFSTYLRVMILNISILSAFWNTIRYCLMFTKVMLNHKLCYDFLSPTTKQLPCYSVDRKPYFSTSVSLLNTIYITLYNHNIVTKSPMWQSHACWAAISSGLVRI